MPVDVGDENIRVRVKDPGLFVDDSFRTITVSDDQGIKAVIGKLKSDPSGSTKVQSYIFSKAKGWTSGSAEKWVNDHKKSGPANMERRCQKEAGEMRLSYDSGSPKMVGYAAVFNTDTELYTGFFENVVPGAFSNTIKSDDIRALWNHNPDYLLGRTKNQTLSLREDEKGLYYEISPPDTTWAKDVFTLIKRGDVSQSSFGFNIIDQDLKHVGKKTIRSLTEVKLFDVSPVTYPAYSQTEVHVRMIAGEKENLYLFEDTDEVVEVPTIIEAPQPDINFFQSIEDFKKKILG